MSFYTGANMRFGFPHQTFRQPPFANPRVSATSQLQRPKLADWRALLPALSLASLLLAVGSPTPVVPPSLWAQNPATPDPAQTTPPRCEIIPLADHRFEMRIDGQLRTVWHFPHDVPRPFLFPLIGPSGQSVTRMGHPGAPDHDHHRSVWFAHYKVDGFDFWSENGGTKIIQNQWYALEDGDDAARLAFQLHWLAPDDQTLLWQDVILELQPASAAGEERSGWQLEIQTTLRPAAERSQVTLQKTNFGLLAVRVSKSLSAAFGQGLLTADDGQTGEPSLFGKPHRWVDYSGASASGEGQSRSWFAEGITYFDHPSNPGFPNAWHVRQDGWMCTSPTLAGDLVVTAEQPLTLRYLLRVHADRYDAVSAERVFQQFADSARFELAKSKRPHTRYEINRRD
ncbi:PmoA family protein [Planctomycetaceae bacterium SH139]